MMPALSPCDVHMQMFIPNLLTGLFSRKDLNFRIRDRILPLSPMGCVFLDKSLILLKLSFLICETVVIPILHCYED